ncbi:MAG: ferrous iron transport protein B [Peptococcia bacterium]|jgi:ferrous iron transport protein B
MSTAVKNIALIGNPNTGKTCLFNCLTGTKQRVGNWPGVTVEKKEGSLLNHQQINIVDLPGIYSLGAHTEDELVARNFILLGKPDLAINVVDATNLQRNLYLTLQLLEMNVPVVMALNMMDEAKKNNIKINIQKLSSLLGIPIIPTIARTKKGIKELVQTSLRKEIVSNNFTIDYGATIETEIEKIEKALRSAGVSETLYPLRLIALKLLEGDNNILDALDVCEVNSKGCEAVLATCYQSRGKLENYFQENINTIFIQKRYKYIDYILQQTVSFPATSNTYTVSDKIDKIVLNKYIGLPLFFLIMLLVFKLTFIVSKPFEVGLEMIFSRLGSFLGTIITNKFFASFLVEGLIGGIGAIIIFLPIILCIFLAISLLENSGYMSRGAYLMDRFMRKLGLEGKAIIPLVVGFGCNVPAILSTRTLQTTRDKMITILIIPLISCGARLPVYALFVGAFFQQHQGLVLFSLYLLGIILAIIMAKIFKRFLFPGEATPLLLELPPYRLPSLKDTLIQMGEKSSSFFKKVGTIILCAVIVAWGLSNFPWGVEYAGPDSLMGKIGALIAPIFEPLGFGTREAASALLLGIVAKEVVVSTLGVLYGTGQEGLITLISQQWTALSAYSFMVMTLIYIPCAGVIGAIKAETGSWKWTIFTILYTFTLGWLVAFLVYQGGLMLGLGM